MPQTDGKCPRSRSPDVARQKKWSKRSSVRSNQRENQVSEQLKLPSSVTDSYLDFCQIADALIELRFVQARHFRVAPSHGLTVSYGPDFTNVPPSILIHYMRYHINGPLALLFDIVQRHAPS